MTDKNFTDTEATEAPAYCAPKLTRYGDMIEMTAGSSNKTMNEGMGTGTMRNKV